ncbi:MAG: flavocytochrome c [Anaerolineae bacterium]|nr:flavocytochrome c [Anaerolineae bacterium]
MQLVTPQQEKTTRKVVVVGGGGAGLCAAIAAADAGAAEVTLIEKTGLVGGDTLISGQVISAAGTRLQKAAGIEDSPAHYLAELLKGGRYRSDPLLAATLVEHGAAAWDWLEATGCKFPGPEGLHVQHDHTIARSVKFAPPGLVGPLKGAAEARGVRIVLNTKATQLIVESGRVAGVEAEQDGAMMTFPAGGVVLATGGFGRNPDMIRAVCPALAEAVSWSMPGMTGDGIVMAQALGADVVDNRDLPLDSFRVIQSGADVKQQVLYPTYLLAQIRGLGGIFVGVDGRRFYDEMGRSNEMVQAAMARGPHYYLIFDTRMAQPSPWLKGDTFAAQMEIAVNDGMAASKAPTLPELAAKIGVDPDVLIETVTAWNRDVDANTDTEFGRVEGLGKLETPPFYAFRYKPAIVQTLGGLRINPQAQVLDKSGNPIPGLFAAGQVTGGVHGADYIGGSALLEVVVFGILAGQHAITGDHS